MRTSHADRARSAAFSPDGKRIVTASWDATARLWDAATGKPISQPLTGHAGEVISAVFSPDGKRIVTASWDKTARLWDAATGKPLGEPLTGHADQVWSAAFSPDSQRIVTASSATSMLVFRCHRRRCSSNMTNPTLLQSRTSPKIAAHCTIAPKITTPADRYSA